MRIYLHDYGRYPFIGQLARALAARGHIVALSGSGGDSRRAENETGGNVEDRLILPGVPIPKSSFLKRAIHEHCHGVALARDMSKFGPDVVISANTPTLAQQKVTKWCRQHRMPFVFWLQDLLGAGAEHVLSNRFGKLGLMIGRRLSAMENQMLRDADHVIAISEAFREPVKAAGRKSPLTVIPNWAPLDETPVQSRDNEWSRRHNLVGVKTVLYSGTLGMKHDPFALVELAKSFNEGEMLVVVAEGAGTEILKGAERVLVLPLQAYSELPLVLASADILLATLLAEAGAYCVPSKVLTYFCAERSVVLYAPKSNDASKMVQSVGAGGVVEPGDVHGLKLLVRELLEDDSTRRKCGAAARAHAEAHFRIESICDQFEASLISDKSRVSSADWPTIDGKEAGYEG